MSNQTSRPTPLSPAKIADEQAKQAAQVSATTALAKSNTELDTLLAEKSKKIDMLQAANIELQGMLDDVNKTVTMLRGEAKDLQAALDEARQAQVAPASAVADDEKVKVQLLKAAKYDTELPNLKAEIDALKAENRKLRDSHRSDDNAVVKSVQSKLATAQAEIVTLQDKLKSALRQVARIETGGECEYQIHSRFLDISRPEIGKLQELRNDGWSIVWQADDANDNSVHRLYLEKHVAKAEVAPEPATERVAVAKAQEHLATLIADAQALGGMKQPQPTAEITILDEPPRKSPFSKGYVHDDAHKVSGQVRGAA